MQADGWVTIGTKIDTKQLEKDLINATKKLEKYEKESTKLLEQKNKAKLDLREYEKTKRIIETTTERNLKFADSETAKKRILNEQNIQMKELNEAYSKQLYKYDSINTKIKENKYNQSLVNGEIENLNNKLGKVKGFEKIKNSIDGVGKSIQNVIKKVTKWGLAFLGIRTIISLVRQSIGILSQYDEQLSTDVEYMRYALATAIKPIIEWIMKAVYKLLSFVGSLIKMIFGINIFANASAKGFENANKNAKKLEKTLASFDEMNILSDNGSVNSYTPSIDLSDIADNKTLKKLKNFWDEIFNFWEKDWKDLFNDLDGKWGAFLSGLVLSVKGFWDVIKGTIEIVSGIFKIIIGLVTGNFDEIKRGFDLMIKGIKDILTGIIEFVSGILLTIFGVIKGIFLEIADFVYFNVVKPIGNLFSQLGDLIVKGISGGITGIKNAFSGIVKWIKNNITDKIAGFFNTLWSGIEEGVEGVKNTIVNIFNGIKDTITGVINTLIDAVNVLIDGVNTINPFGKIPKIKKIGEKVNKGGGGFRAKGGIFYPSKLPKLAVGGIINQPGRGVPYHGAYIGERGAEAVVPLTDSQQMALLGETIGRYITVELTNITKLDGRQIARKVDKVNQSNDFVFNR